MHRYAANLQPELPRTARTRMTLASKRQRLYEAGGD